MRLLIIGTLSGQVSTAAKIAIARGAKVSQADDVARGLEALRGGKGADLVMIDVGLDIGGLVDALRNERIHIPVVACGIGADSAAAVRAIKAGAKEYIPLPPEPELIAAMLDLGKPVFGICRGLQELNVAFGGTLRRDMAEHPDLLRHHAPDGVSFEEMFDHIHPVRLEEDGILKRAYGRDALDIVSVHYQGVDALGAGLRVEARAPDGVIEAVSANVNGAPVLAVQWHPEWKASENPQSQLFFQLLGRALRNEPLV